MKLKNIVNKVLVVLIICLSSWCLLHAGEEVREKPILEERRSPPEMSGGVKYEESSEFYVTPDSSIKLTNELIVEDTFEVSPSPSPSK